MKTGRGNQPCVRWARCGYWLGAIGLATVMIASTSIRQQAIADDPAADQQPLPADLALVPADAPGFLTIRVADMWTSPLVKKFREFVVVHKSEDGIIS